MDSLPRPDARTPRARGLRRLPASNTMLVLGLLAAAPVGADAVEDPGAAAGGLSSFSLAAGDSAYVHGDFAAARASYDAGLAAQPGSLAALWRLARLESEHGEDVAGDEQKKLFTEAVGHAREAVRVAPDSAIGHVWLAVALGRQALREGPKTRLALSREIKAEADRAIALDPSIGRAWHVLALWNRKVASLTFVERMAANTVLGGVPKGASMDNAVRDLEKAIALEPAYVNHHLELGRTFADLKRWPEARKELETAVALPPTSNPRDPKYQAEARALLAKVPPR